MILVDTSAWVEYDRATGGHHPRGMIDCMIASVAWRRGAALLAHDSDLDQVARVVGLETDDGSPRS